MSAARQRLVTDSAAAGVEFARVDAGYDGVAVVRDTTIRVERGELVGLVGPNGAGKSTLLRTVTGAAELLGGSLHVAGVPVGELDARSRARIVGVVPQSPPVLFAFTAREFVAMGRHAHLGRLASAQEADTAAVERAMDRTDTLRLANERVDTLSGGDVQRLTLAQALAQEPEVLLLDEATSHLDLNHRLQVLDLVRELAEDGLAVLGVFHDLDLAARYSDRLAVVADGAVPVCGSPAEVLTPERLRQVFAVRAVVGTDPVTGSVSVTPILREQAAQKSRSETVFLVCGSGSGASLMRQLALAGFGVSACALNRGDVDYSVAYTLGVACVDLPPFGQIGSAERDAVAHFAVEADAIVVCDVPFGSANVANLEAAVDANRPLVFVGGVAAERDYTGGAALGLMRRAAEVAVSHVNDEAAAYAAVRELLG